MIWRSFSSTTGDMSKMLEKSSRVMLYNRTHENFKTRVAHREAIWRQFGAPEKKKRVAVLFGRGDRSGNFEE